MWYFLLWFALQQIMSFVFKHKNGKICLLKVRYFKLLNIPLYRKLYSVVFYCISWWTIETKFLTKHGKKQSLTGETWQFQVVSPSLTQPLLFLVFRPVSMMRARVTGGIQDKTINRQQSFRIFLESKRRLFDRRSRNCVMLLPRPNWA